MIGCDEGSAMCVTCSAREAVKADCTESKGLLLRGFTSAPPFTSNRPPRPRVEVLLLVVLVEVEGLFSDATTDNDVADADAEEEEGVWWGLRSRERVAMMSPRRL